MMENGSFEGDFFSGVCGVFSMLSGGGRMIYGPFFSSVGISSLGIWGGSRGAMGGIYCGS